MKTKVLNCEKLFNLYQVLYGNGKLSVYGYAPTRRMARINAKFAFEKKLKNMV